MNVKIFLLGVAASFSVVWLFAIVIPYDAMQKLPPEEFSETEDEKEGFYQPSRSGRVDGAIIYAGEGCYLCHTQLIRPTDFGNDMYRANWAGKEATADEPIDSRRETNAYDYQGEEFAQIGFMRIGPDLSNFANRAEEYGKKKGVSAEEWTHGHLYNPRSKPETYWSVCPSMFYLYSPVSPHALEGAGRLWLKDSKGERIPVVPDERAKALVSYLMSLKKDDPIPASVNPRK